MASPAQILANRENAHLSTGPKTQHGKAASSRNSTRHGLTSKQIVLPGEDAAEYDALREDMLASYEPASATESVLVEELAAASWRLLRTRRHETLILKKLAGDNADCAEGFAAVFLEKPKEVDRLNRYITAIERAYYRAMNKLEKVQKERAIAEQHAAIEQAVFESRERRQSKPSNGFVSKSAPTPEIGPLASQLNTPANAILLPSLNAERQTA